MAVIIIIVVIPVIFIARPPKTVASITPTEASSPSVTDDHLSEIILDADTSTNAVKIRRAFVSVCIAFGLLIMSQVAAISHTLTLGQERNLGNTALAVSALATMAVVGRVIGFFVIPHVPLKILSLAMSVIQVTALLLIAFSHNIVILTIGTALMGLTVGNNQVFIPLWVLGIYGMKKYASKFARANFYTALGVALSPVYIGLSHQFSDGYTVPFALVAAGSLVAGLFILTLPNIREN
jgi:MFS family permease